MASPEIVQLKVELTALESRVTGERLRAENLRDTLRHHLPPLKPVEEVDAELIFSLATDFTLAHAALKKTLGEIKAIKGYLE
jgi:hypothetical protein